MHLFFIQKILIVLTFLILALVNKHTEYIKKSPYKFSSDLVASGLAGALGLFAVYKTRGIEPNYKTLTFVFIFFTFFAASREFAGYYTFIESSKYNSQKRFLERLAFIFGSLFCATLIGAALIEQNPFPEMSELFIVTALFTLSEVIIARNHDTSIPLTIATSIPIFAIGHTLLQMGGIYSEIL
jgi:hypothetical protein